MKKAVKIFIPGVLLGVIIAFCQALANVIVYVHDSGIPIMADTLSQYSMIFLTIFGISFLFYGAPCILAIVFLDMLSAHARAYITGLLAGLVSGIVVSFPFLLGRLGVFGTLLFPLDLINMLISVVAFSVAGLSIFKKRNWKPQKAETFSPPPPAVVTPVAQPPAALSPQKRHQDPRLLVGVIAVLLVICAGLALVAGVLTFFSNSTRIADQIWSYRVMQKLMEDGYEVEDVFVERDPQNNLFSRMKVKINGLKSKEYMEYQDFAIDSYEAIFEMADPPLFKPETLGEIDVSYAGGTINVDYEYARRFVQHQISRGEFLQHWHLY
jgi:hypothetical protein